MKVILMTALALTSPVSAMAQTTTAAPASSPAPKLSRCEALAADWKRFEMNMADRFADGVARAEYIPDFRRVDPTWEDTLRPSKIPTHAGTFGTDGQAG